MTTAPRNYRVAARCLTACASWLVLATACTADDGVGPSGALSYARSSASCGPADGPAVEIALAATPFTSGQPSTPFVRVAIMRAPNELAGRSWSVTGDAGGWLYTTATQSEAASSGTITINAVSADYTIDGTVDLRFPSGRFVQSFRAPWSTQRTILCG